MESADSGGKKEEGDNQMKEINLSSREPVAKIITNDDFTGACRQLTKLVEEGKSTISDGKEIKMKHVVSLSGGTASAVAGDLVIKKYGKQNLILMIINVLLSLEMI